MLVNLFYIISQLKGDERPTWARQEPLVEPGEDKEVLEIHGKEYDVHWGTVTNTDTKVTRIVARSWIEGKGWAGKGATRDEARSKLIKYLKDHVKKTMDAGLYQLEDGELVPEPTLTEVRKICQIVIKIKTFSLSLFDRFWIVEIITKFS